jgi:RNA polymerase sigma-54 factor
MSGTALLQKQQLRTIPCQIQANTILNMNILELQQFIETEAMENPALSVDDEARCAVCGFLTDGGPCPICGTSDKHLDEIKTPLRSERDYIELAYSAVADPAFDPFRTVAGTTELRDHLRHQAGMVFGGRRLRIANYIIDCLDDDGYFREPLFDVAEEFAASVPEIESVLAVIQTFDPPGIGARNLRECLLNQLRLLGASDAAASLAERILNDHWEDFSKMRIKVLAAKLHVGQAEIREACEFIRDNLNPHPASMYRPPFDSLVPRETAALVPDVIIHNRGGEIVPEVIDVHTKHLKLDESYERAYQAVRSGRSSMSNDEISHIREQVERVKCILDAIAMRKKTLARVAISLVEYQREFILHGPAYLKPLRQKDLAKSLGVHESTICRAIAGKYCRLPSGEVVSFDVFFDAALPVRNMISQLIARSTEPLSDGEIAKRLAEQGITIARRTVAKYREQLRLLPYHLRVA